MIAFTCPNCSHGHADTEGAGWVSEGRRFLQCVQCACVAETTPCCNCGEPGAVRHSATHSFCADCGDNGNPAPVHVAPCDTCGEPTPVDQALGHGDSFHCPDCFES